MSINACFVALGANPKEIYVSNWTAVSSNVRGNMYRRYEKHELLGWARDLHRKAIKKFHPDQHRGEVKFYTAKTAQINAAFDRIKHLIKYQRMGYGNQEN